MIRDKRTAKAAITPKRPLLAELLGSAKDNRHNVATLEDFDRERFGICAKRIAIRYISDAAVNSRSLRRHLTRLGRKGTVA